MPYMSSTIDGLQFAQNQELLTHVNFPTEPVVDNYCGRLRIHVEENVMYRYMVQCTGGTVRRLYFLIASIAAHDSIDALLVSYFFSPLEGKV